MRKLILALVSILLLPILSFSQQPFYDVSMGNGNGIRFWQADNYKIHMGHGWEYQYGPVTDYSIKSNMNSDPARGWTWGITGQAPVAAINTQGHMQIAGSLTSMSNILSHSSNGYMALSGDLPGNPPGTYPTLKTNGPTIHFSVANKYSAYLTGTNPMLGLVNTNFETAVALNSNGASYFNGGNVGIGITSPTHKLQVNGQGDFAVDFKVNGRMQTGDGVGNGGVWLNSAQSMFIGQVGTKVGIYNNDWRLMVDNTGKVGIGTSTPDEMLTVNGKINSEEIIVSPSVPAPDYVFEKTYDLASLDEVQAYITQHKHLPEVPSAKEIEKDGLKVGEMEFILLKKIEEMTLYMIELKNQNSILSERVNQLERKK